MFSKQHFEKFASLIRNSEATSKQEFILEVVKLFQADNAKFKTQKFFIKSGLKTGVELNNGLNEPKKVNNPISESIYLKVIPSMSKNENLQFFTYDTLFCTIQLTFESPPLCVKSHFSLQ